MKKQKIGFILNIATICLALVAIVVGVYSLNQAKLNINGSLGFVAHNVKANIVTSITGSVAEANATYSKTDVFKPSGDAGITLNGDTQNISFTRYFSDNGTVNNKPAPIKVSFAITNQSNFDIKVDVSTPTLPTGVTMTTDKSSIKIAQNASGNITATFYLDSSSTGLETTPITGLTLELSKFEFKKSDITVKYTDSALTTGAGLLSNYYIKYGTGKVGSTTYDINWFIIGSYGTDGQIKTLTPATDFTKTLSTTVTTGKILKDNVTYAFMSDYILTSGGGTTNETKHVPFNNNMFKNTADNEYYSNEYTSVKANDYSISTVRAYLNGRTVNTATDTSTSNIWKPNTATDKATNLNFFTQNTLKGNNETNDIYTLIQSRTLGDLYKKMSDASTDTTLPTAVEGISGTDADAFWLLSYSEASRLWDSNANRKGMIVLPKTDDTSSYTTSPNSWGTRSPASNNSDIFGAVEDSGYVLGDSSSVYGAWCPVRPAFLI